MEDSGHCQGIEEQAQFIVRSELRVHDVAPLNPNHTHQGKWCTCLGDTAILTTVTSSAIGKSPSVGALLHVTPAMRARNMMQRGAVAVSA